MGAAGAPLLSDPSPPASARAVVTPRWQVALARWPAVVAILLAGLLLVMMQWQPRGLQPPDGWAARQALSELGGRRSGGGGGKGGSKVVTSASLKPPRPPCLFNTLVRHEDVQWSTTAEGAVDKLSIRGCELRRYSAAEAKQCLAGKRLVFVGDSVTRYAYLSLLYFLEKGRWPAPLGAVPGDPSVANEHEWPSWNDFLKGTAALFGGREACDCYRAEFADGRKPTEAEKFENRFYEAGGLSIAHLTYTTEPNKIHGHYGFPPYALDRRPCAPATCSRPADWGLNLTRALAHPIREMEPTHVILNSGLWGSSNAFGEDAWRGIAAAGRLAVSERGGRSIWRTTTASYGRFPSNRDTDAAAVAATAAAGWGVWDAYALTLPLVNLPKAQRPLWDGRHFLAVVYRELNLYLLNMLCHPSG